MAGQLEDLDGKSSSVEKASKSLREQVEELTDQLQEETRAKIAANNKQKQLQDEVERLNGQLEDEEEAKDALQNKLVATNAQVYRQGTGLGRKGVRGSALFRGSSGGGHSKRSQGPVQLYSGATPPPPQEISGGVWSLAGGSSNNPCPCILLCS